MFFIASGFSEIWNFVNDGNYTSQKTNGPKPFQLQGSSLLLTSWFDSTSALSKISSDNKLHRD